MGIAMLVVVLAAGAIVSGLARRSRGEQASASTARFAGSTATVERRTLTATVSESGVLTYAAQADGSPYTVINQARGTYTRLPAAGGVITSGHVLYRVSDRPVLLLRGTTPAYRTLTAGTTGPDVAQLNRDLVALRYATPAQISRTSATFGWQTTLAVQKLQASLGVDQTGTLTLGQVMFAPGALRVTAVIPPLDAIAQPGTIVLQASSTRRQVQVALDASQQTEVAVGNRVSITLPDNRTTPGVVASVSTVATCPPSSASGGSGSGSATTGACGAAGSAQSSSPTIAVDIAFVHPAASGRWDRAPVQVGIASARVRDVLTVPVTALLARSSGGYAVEVAATDAKHHLVPVSLGLFDDADGLVQVSGTGLVGGQHVVIPAS